MTINMGNNFATVWTEDQDASLKHLQSEGYSGSQIATVLNQQFMTAYSRNAVIGRMHRLKLSKPMVKRAPKEPKPRPPRPDRPKSIIPPLDLTRLRCVEIIPRGLTLLELSFGECKYPYGDISPFLFCGHPSLESRPYCMSHQYLTTRQQ